MAPDRERSPRPRQPPRPIGEGSPPQTLERVNNEIKRRSDVLESFPAAPWLAFTPEMPCCSGIRRC